MRESIENINLIAKKLLDEIVKSEKGKRLLIERTESAFYGWERFFSEAKKDFSFDFFSDCGASKMVFIFNNHDFVIKIPFSGMTNLCEVEVENYKTALMYGYESFLAEAHELNSYTIHTENDIISIPLYCMEKITVGEELVEDEAYKIYIKNNSEELKGLNDNEKSDRFYDYIQYGGEVEYLICASDERGADFLDFCIDWDINDLHKGNVGFNKNGKVVLCDYSGYSGEYYNSDGDYSA